MTKRSLRARGIRFELAILVTTTVLISPAFGIPASPHPFQVEQPGGEVITLHVRGDEYFNWWEDLGSYTVISDGEKYVYAKLGSDGRLAPTKWEVGSVDPAAMGLAPRVLPSPKVRNEIRASRMSVQTNLGRSTASPATTGSVKNVVILLQFSNHAARPLPPLIGYDRIFNAVGGDTRYAPTGSVRDVYLENSYGQLEVNSTVFGWYLLPETEQVYAEGVSGLGHNATYIIDALEAADPDIDFSQFDEDSNGFVDAIAFIHSGYGAEFGGTDVDGTGQDDRIWSHRWNIPEWTSDEGVKVSPYHISSGLWGLAGSNPGRIGVIAHETGHFFGSPDLYDTNGGGEGIGSWGMMANSWGFTNDQYNPPHFCAWNKIRMGWLTPTVVTTPGSYSAAAVETSPVVFRVDAGFPAGEYLLIENRQPLGHESTLPQGGLAVWHIDDTKFGNWQEGYPGQDGWPENNNHYRVAILQADGRYDLERGTGRGDGGDVYHGDPGSVSAINPTTVPNTDSYQNGNVLPTGHSICAVSPPDLTMTFQFGFRNPELSSPPHDARKNRYVSINPNNDGCFAALQVEMTAGPGVAGVVGWVGEPTDPDGTDDWVASVVDTPVYRTWAEEVLHIGDCEIVPVATYRISATVDETFFGDAVEVGTIRKPGPRFHGDVVGINTGDGFTPPQLVVNITDIQAFLFCSQDKAGAPHITWCDVTGLGIGTAPNFIPNVSDLQVLLKGLEGRTYLESHSDNRDPADCP